MNHTIEQQAASSGESSKQPDITVRAMRESDLAEAKRIFHLAFGTFLGLPDPMEFFPDRDFITTRWKANPACGLAAESNGSLIGSNLTNFWGSVGFFGPLTIRPDYWNLGAARHLLESTMHEFEKSQSRFVGLCTFPQSTKHIHLYQKFGFWPRFLTPVMSLTVRPNPTAPEAQTYAGLSEDQCDEFLKASHELTDGIHEGLDLRNEIRAVAHQNLGDTVLLWDHSRLAGFAILHCGANTEAGNGTAYVKFAAAGTSRSFQSLLAACEDFASKRQLTRLEAGVNMGRLDAYQKMIEHGFRTEFMAIAMHRSNDPGYSRPDVYIMDDWR